MELCSREQEVAYAIVCELLTRSIALRARELASEEAKPAPDASRIAALRTERFRLLQQRVALEAHDARWLEQLCRECGSLLRAARERCGQSLN